MIEINNIAAGIAKVALGVQRFMYIGNLSEQVTDYTLRDVVRICFGEIGIDIEFSGKDKYEKGVIIDIDEGRIAKLGLDIDIFRFGEVVVRVDESLIRPTENFDDDLDTIVNEIMTASLSAINHARNPQ